MRLKILIALPCFAVISACSNSTTVDQADINKSQSSSSFSQVSLLKQSSSSSPKEERSEEVWLKYHDDRFGFSIQYPEFVYDWKGNRVKMLITPIKSGINFGYDQTYRSIIVSYADSDQDILNFIHSFYRFGTGCEFTKTVGEDEIVSIRVIGNGEDIFDPKMTCITNFAYRILHQPSTKKIALIFYDQEGLFSKPEDEIDENSDGYYDTEIGGSFQFDKPPSNMQK